MPCVSLTDFRTTDLVDVNWTVTVINQRQLPPMLSMTRRITSPAHRREWTQIFGGKKSEPETSRPVDKMQFYGLHLAPRWE